jgi:hypothetical protein
MSKSERTVQHTWSVPVLQAEVPQAGRHFHMIANEETRTSIARLAGIPALPRLEAEFDVDLHGRNGLHVVGRVSATVCQTCSVTLEPMTSEVNEDVDLIYLPPPAGALGSTIGREIEVLLEDEPETLTDGRVDLGVLATEFLMLGIDPYPRKPDSIFEPPAEPRSEGPFAALARLGKTPPPNISGRNARKKG